MTHIFYFKLNGGFFTFFQEHSCPQVKKCRSTIGFCLEHLSACRYCTHQQHQFTKAKLRLINREMTFRLHKTAPISASTVPGLLGWDWVRFIQKSGQRECLVDSMCFTTASRIRLGFPIINREEPAIADGASLQNVQTQHHKLATRNPSTSRWLNLQTLSTTVTALTFSTQSIHNIVMTTEEAILAAFTWQI